MMIAVVGASGAGKDSLLNMARQYYEGHPELGFVRRVITRPADGSTEDHQPVTVEQFEARERLGQFAVTWGAHGLRYGIPRETVDEVARGMTLLANGSRAAIGNFLRAYPRVAVLEITARPEVIASRLATRGRESADQIAGRLKRDTGNWKPECRHISIDNSDCLKDAAMRLRDAIESLRQNGI